MYKEDEKRNAKEAVSKLTDAEIEEITGELKKNLSDDTKKLREIINNDIKESIGIAAEGTGTTVDKLEKIFINPEGENYSAFIKDDQYKAPISTMEPANPKNHNPNGPYPYNAFKDSPLKKTNSKVEVNPESGEVKVMGSITKDSNKTISLTDINENLDKVDLKDVDQDPIKALGLSDEDALNLMNIITRYKEGKDFSIYNAFPKSIKQMVRGLAPYQSMQSYQIVSKDVLEMFINQLNIDEGIIDFQKAIKKEMNLPIMNLYADELKDLMETKLLAQAVLAEKEYPDKAELMRKVSQAFTDSYTLVRQKELINNNTSLRRKLKKGLKRFDKICEEINYKYMHTKLMIKDIYLVIQILNRKLPKEYNTDDIKKFILVYYEVSKNMVPEHIEEHAFMHYSIENITCLDHSGTEDSEFNKNLYNNIIEVIDMIKEKYGELN